MFGNPRLMSWYYCNMYRLNSTTVFRKQRVVNSHLGKNIVKDHHKIYNEIEKRIGQTKKCTFGHKRGSQTGVKHEGCFDVPIREFELNGVYMYQDQVIIKHGDGLQGFCKTCSKRRRKARIDKEKKEKQHKTKEEVYELYKKKYNSHVKKCSRCHEHKYIFEFHVSIGMECGLHNMCKLCTCEYGSSVGDRWIIYMPDGNFKYNKHLKMDKHDDHIFPLSLGGSDHEVNHQLISSIDNQKKSNDITYFSSVSKISPELLSIRYRSILAKAICLTDLKIRLNQSVYSDILYRHNLTDTELYYLYKTYCQNNNLRKNIHRAVKKFREYCRLRL